MALSDRLRRLASQAEAEAERSSNPEARARMKAVLDEWAAAKRDGAPLSPEARAADEYFRERRERGA